MFHEITKDAIQAAIESPRQGRGISGERHRRRDAFWTGCTATRFRRCCGEGSPEAIGRGRVQSVAVRLIVERERERMAFVSATWWTCSAALPRVDKQSLEATMISVDGRRIPAGKDFDSATGKLKNPEMMLLDGPAAAALAKANSQRKVPRRVNRG